MLLRFKLLVERPQVAIRNVNIMNAIIMDGIMDANSGEPRRETYTLGT